MVYKYFEHLADCGIIGIGNSIEESFEEAAKAMFNLMTNISKLQKTRKVKISVSASNNAELFVEFLNELLSLADLNGIMFCDFKIKIEKDNLEGFAFGDNVSKKMELKQEVKAATYSQLEIKKEKGKIISKTVVDL